MDSNIYNHIPVLRDEVLKAINLKNGAVYFDGTAGRGGHIDALLDDAASKGLDINIIAVDKDPVNTEYLKEKYRGTPAVKVVNSDYRFIGDILNFHKLKACDGVVLDLGFSSIHIDDPSRGFSFLRDGPLDMRYSREQDLSAEMVVNEYDESELRKLIRDYGEERHSARIARAIVKSRLQKPIKTSFELRDIIHSVIPSRAGHIDPATRTFQAIRIEVNDELSSLSSFFDGLEKVLNISARLCVISFHSLEDRIVKKSINSMIKPCSCPSGLVDCVCNKKPTFKWFHKSVIMASEEEVKINPRSRSAKLRVAERI